MSRDVWAEGLFREYDSLLRVDVCGVTLKVPENNSLLRCFQFVSKTGLISGNYCWNGDCTNCLVWIEEPTGKTRRALACQTMVTADLRIVETSPELKVDLGL
jgi:2Fe-2S iron-sulfur cluster protein